jgi:hypothetical protein
MPDCVKAKGLIDWLWWSQSSETAVSLARKYVRITPLPYHAVVRRVVCCADRRPPGS